MGRSNDGYSSGWKTSSFDGQDPLSDWYHRIVCRAVEPNDRLRKRLSEHWLRTHVPALRTGAEWHCSDRHDPSGYPPQSCIGKTPHNLSGFTGQVRKAPEESRYPMNLTMESDTTRHPALFYIRIFVIHCRFRYREIPTYPASANRISLGTVVTQQKRRVYLCIHRLHRPIPLFRRERTIQRTSSDYPGTISTSIGSNAAIVSGLSARIYSNRTRHSNQSATKTASDRLHPVVLQNWFATYGLEIGSPLRTRTVTSGTVTVRVCRPRVPHERTRRKRHAGSGQRPDGSLRSPVRDGKRSSRPYRRRRGDSRS